MLPEENEAYGAYELPYQPASSASVGVLDIPPVTQTPPVQEASQPPKYPPGPQTSPPPPQKRPGGSDPAPHLRARSHFWGGSVCWPGVHKRQE